MHRFSDLITPPLFFLRHPLSRDDDLRDSTGVPSSSVPSPSSSPLFTSPSLSPFLSPSASLCTSPSLSTSPRFLSPSLSPSPLVSVSVSIAAVAMLLIDKGVTRVAIGEVAMKLAFLLFVTGVDVVAVSIEAVLSLVVITGVDVVVVSMGGFLVLDMILTLDLGLVLEVVSVFVLSVLVRSCRCFWKTQ